jgi:thiamine biosynthesis lipoprotein
MSGGRVHRHAFPAFGSTVELTLAGRSPVAARQAFRRAEALAEAWDATFSRFRPDSELSLLNRSAGASPFRAGRLLFDAVSASVAAARTTGGLFDPTVLTALVAIGYDRPFSALVDGPAADRASPVAGAGAVELDERRRTIGLPAGVGLDLGGIAKGLYADRLAGELAGWPGGVVSAGGDLRLWGAPPGGDRWRIGVEDPADPARDLRTIALAAGGVATSGTSRRHWRRGGATLHHLIDPRTGLPAAAGLQSVTVVAPTAVHAEVAATALFVAGGRPSDCRWLADLARWAFVVTEDHHVIEWDHHHGETDVRHSRAA